MLGHTVFIDNDDADPLFINVTKDAEVVPEKAFVKWVYLTRIDQIDQ